MTTVSILERTIRKMNSQSMSPLSSVITFHGLTLSCTSFNINLHLLPRKNSGKFQYLDFYVKLSDVSLLQEVELKMKEIKLLKTSVKDKTSLKSKAHILPLLCSQKALLQMVSSCSNSRREPSWQRVQ